jgi:hypothetical protein
VLVESNSVAPLVRALHAPYYTEHIVISNEPVDPCPLCKRPNLHPSDHHLVPRSRGGTEKTNICQDCHDAIHETFSNKELERTYNTVEALLAHPILAKTIAFIAKQDPSRRTRTARVKSQRRRGRNG